MDEGIEADENMEGTDEFKDDSNQHDLIKGDYDSDSECQEHEQGGDQLFEDGSEIPLLEGVSVVIISYCIEWVCWHHGMVCHQVVLGKYSQLQKG